MSRSAFIPRVAPTMTMAAVCVGLCAGTAEAPTETAVLATWRAVWSHYRLVDDRGTERRLAKATLDAPPPPVPLSGPAASGQTLVLRTSGGEVIGSEPLTATKKGPWAHGFWVPETAAARGQFILELRTGEKVLESRPVAIANGGEAPAPPLRLDSLNRSLLARLESREVDAVPDHRADVVSYLQQHDLVYLDPAPTWGEGLPL